MTKIAAGTLIAVLEAAFLAIMDMVWKIEIPTPTNNIIAAHTSSYSRHKAENKPFHHKIPEKVWRSYEATLVRGVWDLVRCLFLHIDECGGVSS